MYWLVASALSLTLGIRPTLRPHPIVANMVTQPDVSKYISQPRPDATKQYIMQQTMVRVKDPETSLQFYCDVLGFNLVRARLPSPTQLCHSLPPGPLERAQVMHREFPQWGFNVYFVAQVDPATIPADPDDQWQFCMRTPGCIELTWNYGSESEPFTLTLTRTLHPRCYIHAPHAPHAPHTQRRRA